MKKFWQFMIGLMIFSSFFSLPCFAAHENPFTKLGRGVTNIVTSPGEYVVQSQIYFHDHDLLTGTFGTLGMGTFRMIQRALGGVYETVTFPIPIPAAYEPLLDPPTLGS